MGTQLRSDTEAEFGEIQFEQLMYLCGGDEPDASAPLEAEIQFEQLMDLCNGDEPDASEPLDAEAELDEILYEQLMDLCDGAEPDAFAADGTNGLAFPSTERWHFTGIGDVQGGADELALERMDRRDFQGLDIAGISDLCVGQALVDPAEERVWPSDANVDEYGHELEYMDEFDAQALGNGASHLSATE